MSYAQHQDEEIINAFFGKDYIGRFLDIGAFDGHSMSNTRALALRGWSGVCVEPSPDAFQRLWQLYEGNESITLLNAAVASETGIRTFFPDKTEYRYGSTLNEHWAANSHIAGAKPYLVNAVGIMDLLSFFTEPFDFVSIDTEGEDFNILTAFEWGWGFPKLLCVETSAAPGKPWMNLLADKGFVLHANTPTNLYAVRV